MIKKKRIGAIHLLITDERISKFLFSLFIFFVVACGLLSSCGMRVFSLSSCGVQAPGSVDSVVCGMWVLSLRHANSVVVAPGLSCPAAWWDLSSLTRD